MPFPPPGDLPNSGIEPGSPALQADSLPTELQGNVELSTYVREKLGDLKQERDIILFTFFSKIILVVGWITYMG